MGSQNNLPRRIRFGVFEADFRAGEVYRQGRKIKLQGQPFQVLSLLLEQPGEVVTRDDLRRRIWPNDTFVDFDQGLNKAVLKIREALGDDATKPRFIETLPRRGYRLIVPVEPVQVADSPGNGNGHLTTAPGERAAAAGLNAAPAAPLAAEVPVKLPRSEAADHRLPRGAFMTTAACLCLVAVAYGLRPSLPSPRVRRIVRLTNDRRPKLWPIVADSTRLYFTERIGSHLTTVALSTEGGEAVPIPAPVQGAAVLDISRDGSELLMTNFEADEAEGPIWAVPVSGAPARRLGDLEVDEAVWSPDGREILYTKGYDDPHLYLANSDGTALRALVKVPGRPYDLQWSPDGRRISVSVDDGKSNMLWEVSAGGTNLHPVLPGWNFPRASCSGHWTSDGKYLLFDSYIGGPDNIWAIREKGGFFRKASRQPVQLTTGPLDVGKPVPSKDGKRIYTISEGERPRLSRYDSKSKTWKPFLHGISAENVDFSRDGQWVAYVSYPEAILFRSRIDGSQRLQLTIPPVQAAMPQISPDGKTIAYMARTLGKPWRIWLTAFAGGPSRRLTSDDFEEVEPTWSPDGRSLAFCRSRSEGAHTIFLFDMATRRISSLPSLAMPYFPRWSPDGRYIAATDGSQKIVRFDLRTRKWEVLFKSPEQHLYEPSWSHDGRSIYFLDVSPNTRGYYRFRLRDHKIEKLVGLDSGVLETSGITSGWHGLTPDDSLIVLLNDETPEIYALEWDAP